MIMITMKVRHENDDTGDDDDDDDESDEENDEEKAKRRKLTLNIKMFPPCWKLWSQ